ncbi:hypothetical protein [Baaleninema simplex]|uniref:hypothetical protein n=1 Tax=Baaleninema simplex TaxID=2862350 RepID=UPI000371EDB1|nr:hypothetical protein [Baaleninema simplex]
MQPGEFQNPERSQISVEGLTFEVWGRCSAIAFFDRLVVSNGANRTPAIEDRGFSLEPF